MIELPENPFYRDGAAKGYAQCQKEMLRWFVEWVEEDCPHKKEGWHTPRWRSECYKCVKELKEKLAELER